MWNDLLCLETVLYPFGRAAVCPSESRSGAQHRCRYHWGLSLGTPREALSFYPLASYLVQLECLPPLHCKECSQVDSQVLFQRQVSLPRSPRTVEGSGSVVGPGMSVCSECVGWPPSLVG